ncbi:ninja-family protein 3-like, partial [Phalaenopsis equestris]|uniref:ninja-family protein 3-like n=1 Tax=Phalaenopsis equestris TaxID=78828 RepID=UPI0009E21080
RKRKELQSLKRLEAKRKREEKKNISRPAVDADLCVGVPPRPSGCRPLVSPTTLTGMRRSSLNFDSWGSRVPEIPALNNNNNSSVVSSSPSTPDTIQRAARTPPPASALRTLRSLGENDEAMKRMMNHVSKDMKSNIMEEMPCVSTRGDGPSGKKIEGFLYRYKKGEDVSIVCVCHGSFLTPAEFIKHAGGGDVDHPLRHIVVNPSTSQPPYY